MSSICGEREYQPESFEEFFTRSDWLQTILCVYLLFYEIVLPQKITLWRRDTISTILNRSFLIEIIVYVVLKWAFWPNLHLLSNLYKISYVTNKIKFHLWPAILRICGQLSGGSVASYLEVLWPGIWRICFQLSGGSVANYMEDLWPVIWKICGQFSGELW